MFNLNFKTLIKNRTFGKNTTNTSGLVSLAINQNIMNINIQSEKTNLNMSFKDSIEFREMMDKLFIAYQDMTQLKSNKD